MRTLFFVSILLCLLAVVSSCVNANGEMTDEELVEFLNEAYLPYLIDSNKRTKIHPFQATLKDVEECEDYAVSLANNSVNNLYLFATNHDSEAELNPNKPWSAFSELKLNVLTMEEFLNSQSGNDWTNNQGCYGITKPYKSNKTDFVFMQEFVISDGYCSVGPYASTLYFKEVDNKWQLVSVLPY